MVRPLILKSCANLASLILAIPKRRYTLGLDGLILKTNFYGTGLSGLGLLWKARVLLNEKDNLTNRWDELC